jgi:uncharacterized protein
VVPHGAVHPARGVDPGRYRHLASRGMRFVLALATGLTAWSFVANLALGDTLYVPRNLGLTALLLLLARRAGIGPDDLGLARRHLGGGLRWGSAAAAAVAAVLAIGASNADAIGPLAVLLDDDRADLPAASLAFVALVRVPLGTAVFEEVAFRGLLLAACRRVWGTTSAVAVSSLVFGLWHIAPTAVTLGINDVDPLAPAGLAAIAGSVVVTTVAGVGFSLLRLRSRSLLAPVLAHWATNSFGLLAATATR